MTREELLKFHKDFCDRAHALSSRKNCDYATGQDAYLNLSLCEKMGWCSTEIGILIRLSDKLSRLGQLLQNDYEPKVDESVEDTLLDIVNYAVLLAGKRKPVQPVYETATEYLNRMSDNGGGYAKSRSRDSSPKD